MTNFQDFDFQDFSEIDFIVQATDFEHQALWERYNAHCEWVQQSAGIRLNVGELAGMPVFISLRFAKINGNSVLFYDALSQVVDWRKIDAWRKDNFLLAPHVNAQNFHPVVKNCTPPTE